MTVPEISEDITNEDLVLAMLRRLGGVSRYVDIEELTLALFEIAPARFSWRTRRDLPEREVVRFALFHANQRAARDKRRPVVSSRDRSRQWRLTAAGVREARQAGTKTSIALAVGQPPKQTGKSHQRVSQVRRHGVFSAFANGSPVSDISHTQLADLLLIPPDAPLDVAQSRVDALRGAALDIGDKDVARFAEALDEEVGSKWR